MIAPLHALITGGSRGIGLAIAQLLARHHYRCTLISRSSNDLNAALNTLSSPGIPRSSTTPHRSIAGDVASRDFWAKVGEELVKERDEKEAIDESARRRAGAGSGRIDVLVNCAGRTQAKSFKAMSDDELQGMIDTNLTGMMLGTRMLLRKRLLGGANFHSANASDRSSSSSVEQPEQAEDGLTKHHSPVIINIASLLGVQGGHGAVAYATSKAGVLGFTRALATESSAYGVRVNGIVPGYVETDMTKGLDAKFLVQRIPLRRFGTPEEIASAVLFLAQNEYAHNCILNLDGGLSAT